MPAILDSLFHKVVNTTSIPIGVEGGGLWVATKWQGVPIQKLLWPKGFNSGCFQLHMSQNVATVQLNSNLSHARDWRDSTREI